MRSDNRRAGFAAERAGVELRTVWEVLLGWLNVTIGTLALALGVTSGLATAGIVLWVVFLGWFAVRSTWHLISGPVVWGEEGLRDQMPTPDVPASVFLPEYVLILLADHRESQVIERAVAAAWNVKPAAVHRYQGSDPDHAPTCPNVLEALHRYQGSDSDHSPTSPHMLEVSVWDLLDPYLPQAVTVQTGLELPGGPWYEAGDDWWLEEADFEGTLGRRLASRLQTTVWVQGYEPWGVALCRVTPDGSAFHDDLLDAMGRGGRIRDHLDHGFRLRSRNETNAGWLYLRVRQGFVNDAVNIIAKEFGLVRELVSAERKEEVPSPATAVRTRRWLRRSVGAPEPADIGTFDIYYPHLWPWLARADISTRLARARSAIEDIAGKPVALYPYYLE